MAQRTGRDIRGREDNKIDWRRRWSVFGLIAVGLGLTLGGLRALVTPDVSGFLQQGLILLDFGIGAVIVGLLVLWFQGICIRDLLWVELVLLLLISGVVVSILSLLSPLPSWLAVSADVELPIPAESLTGGTGPLSPGQVVELVASVPDASGTPVPATYTDLEVLALLDREGEKGTVLVAVPPESAQGLQKDLITENAHFTYQMLPGTPTPTITPTATLTPTITPAPSGDTIYLELNAPDIQPRASTLVSGTARLVMVEKLEAPLAVVEKGKEPEGTPVAISTYAANSLCVKVVAFLDEDGGHQNRYDKNSTEHVLIQLPAHQLTDAARSLAGAEKIWMVNVECTVPEAP